MNAPLRVPTRTRTPVDFAAMYAPLFSRIDEILLLARGRGDRCPGFGHAGQFDHRSDFDSTETGPGDARRDRDRLVEVLRFHQEIPSQLFARLCERAVGDEPPAVANADAGRGRRGMKRGG